MATMPNRPGQADRGDMDCPGPSLFERGFYHICLGEQMLNAWPDTALIWARQAAGVGRCPTWPPPSGTNDHSSLKGFMLLEDYSGLLAF